MTPHRALGITEEEYARRVRRHELAKRVFIILALIYAAAIPAILLYVITGIEEQQDATSAIVREVRATTDLVESCTVEGNKCFDDSQRRTAEAVGAIVNEDVLSDVVTAACVDVPGQQSEKEIRECVDRRLAARRAERQAE